MGGPCCFFGASSNLLECAMKLLGCRCRLGDTGRQFFRCSTNALGRLLLTNARAILRTQGCRLLCASAGCRLWGWLRLA